MKPEARTAEKPTADIHHAWAEMRDDGGNVYIALCSCGWHSRTTATKRDAENEADDHVLAATA